jgi:hypothetical protein
LERLVVQNRIRQLLPAITKTDALRIAGFCMAPVWIAEVVRMVLAAGLFVAGKGEPTTVFRNILGPTEWLSNPAELITVVGAAAMIARLYFSVRQRHTWIRMPKIAIAALSILAALSITYVLTGFAASFAMASTISLRFM